MADRKDFNDLRQNGHNSRSIVNPNQSNRDGVEGDSNFISLNDRRNNLPINPNPIEDVSEPLSLVVNKPKVMNNQDANRANSDKVNARPVDNNEWLIQQGNGNGRPSERPDGGNHPTKSSRAETVGTKRENYNNQDTSDLVSSTTLGVIVRNLKRRANDVQSYPSLLANKRDHSQSLSAVSSSTSYKRRSIEVTKRHNRNDGPDPEGFLKPRAPDDKDNWREKSEAARRRSFSLEALLSQRPSVIQHKVYVNRGPAHVIANQANRLSDDPNECQLIGHLVRRYSAPIERCSTESEAMPPVTSTTPL